MIELYFDFKFNGSYFVGRIYFMCNYNDEGLGIFDCDVKLFIVLFKLFKLLLLLN